MASNTKCPKGSITSFPVKLGFTPTQAIYDSANESFPLSIQWGQRTTPPVFFDAETGETDETNLSSSNLTTLRYSGYDFKVSSVQIAQATHSQWLLGSYNPTMNPADVIITFTTPADGTPYKYIILISPLIKSANPSTKASCSYLNGLVGTDAKGPFSLRDCFPADNETQFAYYTTCLAASTVHGSVENAVICVNLAGLPIDASVLETLSDKIAVIGSFPIYNPDFLVSTSSQVRIFQNHSDFLTYCLTTTDFLDYAGLQTKYKAAANMQRTDATDAYKCVPLDPDSMIQNGQLTVDLDSGIPLTQIQAQRQAVQDGVKTSFTWMTDLHLEQYVSTGIGILLTVLLVFGTLFGVMSFLYRDKSSPPVTSYPVVYSDKGYSYSNGLHKHAKHSLPENIKRMSFFAIIGIVLTLSGFLIGYLTFSKKGSN